jgi:hypothetical protein
MTRAPRFFYVTALYGVLVLLATACAPSKPRNMADACQLRECVCAKDEAFWRLKEQAPVQWNRLGGAYCTDGYTLQIKSSN